MKTTRVGACAAKAMTACYAAALGVALALAGCQKAQETPAPLDAANSPVVVIAPPAADDPLAAAKAPDPASPTQTQAAQDTQDNARSREVALRLAAHPHWLARQEVLCGPDNAVLQARYAARQGPPDAELRDLKVACLAKDIAREAVDDAETRKGGVEDTDSL